MGKDDPRSYPLYYTWGKLDPAAARAEFEQDISGQNEDAARGLLEGWMGVDRPAAIDYLAANAERPNFEPALKAIPYGMLREAPDDARALILRLSKSKGLIAMEEIADTTSHVILGVPEGYQRPPEEVAAWMTTLPRALWEDKIGDVLHRWDDEGSESVKRWLNTLPVESRDAAQASYCRAAPSEKSHRALTLGFDITDAKLREASLLSVLQKLGNTSEEINKAIDESEMSGAQKLYLRGLVKE